MNDEYSNQLNAFTTTLQFANDPERNTVWDNQIPKAFGTKIDEAEVMLGPVADWLAKQSASILGAAEGKAIKEEGLEEIASLLSEAVATYLLDQDDVAGAEPFRRTPYYWQTLKDQELLARTQDLIAAVTPLTTGANAATIAENYGISAARLTTLTSERADFAAIVAAPAAARAGRAGYTALAREKLKPLKGKFREMDRLVRQFQSRPGGDAFIAGWFSARKVVDAGHGPGTGGGGGTPPNPLKAIIDSATVQPSGAVLLVFHATGTGDVTYRVLRLQEGVPDAEFEELATGLTEGTFTTTPQSGTFIFKVIATNDTGDGPESAPVTVTVPA